MTSTVKATRPDRLTKNETLTSFEDWSNRLELFLSQDKDLVAFLDPNCGWYKFVSKIANHGLECNAKLHNLKRFLGIIASLAPPLLHGDIVNDATSLIPVYNIIRSYY